MISLVLMMKQKKPPRITHQQPPGGGQVLLIRGGFALVLVFQFLVVFVNANGSNINAFEGSCK
jgi:hypothetical protein